jgi:maleate cis-trans isomerase
VTRLAGILTPQANATVEAEMRVLLPREVPSVVARLTCPSTDSRERLLGYFHGVRGTLAQFDTAPLAVAAFACTGSTYLVGAQAEAEHFSRARVPVISAAAAVFDALRALRATKIALLSPYPQWLTDACVAYWGSRDIEVVAIATAASERSDTRAIYSLTAADAVARLAALDTGGAHAVLISGTGMPSLEAIATAEAGVPVISSNLCLGWRVCDFLSPQPIDAWVAPQASWRSRL